MCYAHFKQTALFKMAKWCVACEPYEPHPSEIKMRYCILRLQGELSLDEKYRINEDELDIVNGILKSFQTDLIRKYFNDVLPFYMKYTDEVCFMLYLNHFLEKHQCDLTFNNNEMYTTRNYKSYEACSFSATYVLTDYAITYYKLLYTAQLYGNKLHNITSPNALGSAIAEGTKRAIDTREIDVNNFG